MRYLILVFVYCSVTFTLGYEKYLEAQAIKERQHEEKSNIPSAPSPTLGCCPVQPPANCVGSP